MADAHEVKCGAEYKRKMTVGLRGWIHFAGSNTFEVRETRVAKGCVCLSLFH